MHKNEVESLSTLITKAFDGSECCNKLYAKFEKLWYNKNK